MSKVDYTMILKTNNKKSFALFTTIILVTLFSILSISIMQTHTLSSNINKLKYLNLQANIHMKYIQNFIKTHTKNEIEQLKINDARFSIIINSISSNNKTIYNVQIETIDDTNIRLFKQIM